MLKEGLFIGTDDGKMVVVLEANEDHARLFVLLRNYD